MAATHRAPKQWCLTRRETVNSFENWKQNILYSLSCDNEFSNFLSDGFTWAKVSKSDPCRGFSDDPESAGTKRRTKVQKVRSLELMLGQIANFCPVISRGEIIKKSTSLAQIWQTIRLHYGFQSTGAHFIDFSDIRLDPDESPEDLYQRILAFVEDNLLTKESNITHHGSTITEDEEMSPTLENMIVLTWLQLINKNLPNIVKQRYGTELRSRTLASIKPEISQALPSLLDDIRTSEDARIMKTSTYVSSKRFSNPRFLKNKPPKTCPLCKAAGRMSNHFLSECKFLPEPDRKYMTRARQIAGILDLADDDGEDHTNSNSDIEEEAPVDHNIMRVQVRQSPYINAFYKHRPIHITIDSGATGNMIRSSTAECLGVKVSKSTQSAHQADGSSPLIICGETRFNLTYNNHIFEFEGLVVENLDVEVLAGTPFMERNDVSIRPAKRQVILGDETIIQYGPNSTKPSQHSIRKATVVRGPHQSTTVWPDEFIEVTIPEITEDLTALAIEPRMECSTRDDNMWPAPDILTCIASKIRIHNPTNSPQVIKKDSHFCQVLPIFNASIQSPPVKHTKSPISHEKRTHKYSEHVQLDPDNTFPSHTKEQFSNLLNEFDDVFNPKFTGYNKAVGPFEAVVNRGPTLPPQRKGRVPQYNRDKLSVLQEKFDELEELGVFKRPEDIGVNVEYVNPSFLIKKSSGGYRLVTAFADVGRYSKPQPSLLPNVDDILRQIGQWQFIIATDLSSAFYQIPLARDSMKYCGVATPFKGVRVYVRSAMGMPGSETALEELMCRVLGDLLQDGAVAKLADDLYCGGNSLDELFTNWRKVLTALSQSALCLSASKTVIGPSSTTILGWKWNNGTIQASKHKISTLSSCTKPKTVTNMRSFIGAYKVLSRVIPNCASYLTTLEKCTSGLSGHDEIDWSTSLSEAFTEAQEALKKHKAIHLPRADDQLWIVTDGSVKKQGIGATLYIKRDDERKPRLAGFFSARLKDRQVNWLPCEIEALSIAVATKHFSPYLIQSKHNTCILTDSKPCVQAYEKLCRGEFSASPRVSTFLSTVSRYQASVRHIAGVSNLPSDHASRNAPNCHEPNCQVCQFINKIEDSVIRNISMKDIMEGKARLPFTNRSTWINLQAECPDVRRTRAHLHQGTRPSKKLTSVKDIKRYLQVASIAKDGLLVVKRQDPFGCPRECIIIPRSLLAGLLCALHVQLDHPSEHQLEVVCQRYIYALDMRKAITKTTKSCHSCTAIQTSQEAITLQSSCDPPEAIGIAFAADVLRRERQYIFVIRECVTSFTLTALLESEKHECLRDAIIRLCIELCPLDGPFAVVRTDPAPGFKALENDDMLRKYRINIELGRTKNSNKNPVAEKAVRELENELIRLDPLGNIVSSKQLAIATARLNTRIRNRGLSSREMWFQRDQFNNNQIPVDDQQLISKQHVIRKDNHEHSQKAKAPHGREQSNQNLCVGDIVYIHQDYNKHKARNRYLVCSIEGEWCSVKKFIGTKLRNTSYRVKSSECYKVPCDIEEQLYPVGDWDDVLGDDVDQIVLSEPPVPPQIPTELSTPEGLSTNSENVHHGGQHVETTAHDICENTMDSSHSMDSLCVPENEVRVPRRSGRTRQLPKWHKDYVHN